MLTGIGSWSVADLRRAMQHGVARNGDYLFPAFPYVSFTKVSDADITAIYAYLKTLPAVRYRPPDNGPMFAMRWPMLLWNGLYFKPERFAISLARSGEWNRGAYLVEGLGHCGACHTPRNLLLAELPAEAYQGGALRDSVSRADGRRWSGFDLTASPRGLAAWSITDLTQYSTASVPGPAPLGRLMT